MKRRLLWACAVVLTIGGVIAVYVSQRIRLAERLIRINVNGASLEGTLYTPSASEKLPTVLVLHGSGPDGRSNSYYRILAQTFARCGYATFVYDKRGSGSSTGSWIASPFQRLIDDAVAVADSLKKEREVNRLIIWGGSEGASIAPEVAVRSNASAVIAQSASGVPFWQQNRFQNLQVLKRAGLSETEIQKELLVHEAAMNYARTAKGWDRFSSLRENGSRLRINNSREDVWWDWYRTKMDYDPSPWLRKLQVPILAVWGGSDALVPIEDSRESFRKSLSMNHDVTLMVFPQADHGLSVSGNLVQLESYASWLKKTK